MRRFIFALLLGFSFGAWLDGPTIAKPPQDHQGDPQDISPVETDQKTGHGWRQWGLFHVRLKDGRIRWVYGWINWDGYIGVDRIVPDPRLSP